MRGGAIYARTQTQTLTCHEHFDLLVVEVALLLREQAALGALPDRVHEAHAGQRHLLAAALVAEAATATPAVVLHAEKRKELADVAEQIQRSRQSIIRTLRLMKSNLVSHCIHFGHCGKEKQEAASQHADQGGKSFRPRSHSSQDFNFFPKTIRL